MNCNNNCAVTCEIEIINEMLELTQSIGNFLQNIQNVKNKILKKIIEIDNNYFTKKSELLSKFNHLFDKLTTNELIDETIDFTNYANDILLTSCHNHEYIDDLIDIDVDRSLKVTYCKICEVTKMK
jgi:hypothetical protein